MGQWFKLVNLDKRKTFQLCKLCESLYDLFIHVFLAGSTFELLTTDEFLSEQGRWLQATAEYDTRVLRYRRRNQMQSALLKMLPVEIIAMCVASAESAREKACFALTCLTVWDIARPDLLKALHAETEWQGDRILVLGEYVTVDDMPPNVLNDEERTVIRNMREGPAESGDEDEPPHVGEFLGALGASEAGSVQREIKDWLWERHFALSSHPHRDFTFQDHYNWDVLVQERARAVEARGTVLRNLTTHEYVRGDAHHEARKAAGRPYDRTPLYSWPFADILLMRICWSPSSDAELLDGHNPRNVWAGHRFDFAREDALPRDGEGKVLPPWKDVSEEYMEELSEWSAAYDEENRRYYGAL
ncbi:hypothetical protein AURDEDRAFT_127810 [Auricularia subglabra TFB-10046 SS5]|uniref:Uncharacterized protein n=1 Tax=Auricularia subglabra (strain TFB-10046 / SS5) TaxID=717982 RepID=J0WXU6_AURST|nr:hypothetical protein AURDEDRAFT_127810 [Auricularia subglabra TFB-10046 SS5]